MKYHPAALAQLAPASLPHATWMICLPTRRALWPRAGALERNEWYANLELEAEMNVEIQIPVVTSAAVTLREQISLGSVAAAGC